VKPLEEAVLLRAFVSENDRCGKRPLYEAVVLKAREMHLTGATVFRGPIGFGQSHRLHTARLWPFSFDLPVVIEIVDRQDHIDRFLAVLGDMMPSGTVTLEKVKILRYGRSGELRPTP
jgi:PII-like signaling protein